MDGRKPAQEPQAPFETDESRATFYNFNTLTPQRLKTILFYADNEGRVDLLYKLYDDMEVTDTRYGGIVNQLKSTIAGMPLRVQPAEGRSTQEEEVAEEYATYAREVIEGLDTHTLTKEFITPYMKGAAAYQLDWMQQDLPYRRSMYFPKKVKPIDGRFFRMEWDHGDPDHGKLQIRTNQNPDGETIEGMHYSTVLFLEDGFGEERYPRMGVARSVLPWYISLRFVKTWWIRYIENYGTPTRIGKYPQNASRSKRMKMKKFLQKLGQNGYGLFPQGFEVQLQEASNQQNNMTHQSFIDKGHSEYNIHILGQDATSGDDRNGSFAKTAVLNGIREDIMKNSAELSAKGYRGLIKKGLRLNYGDKYLDHLCPKVKPILLNSRNARERAEAGNIAQQAGVPVPETFWYENTLGVERPQKGQSAVVHGQMFTVGVDPVPEPKTDSEGSQGTTERPMPEDQGGSSVANGGPGESGGSDAE